MSRGLILFASALYFFTSTFASFAEAQSKLASGQRCIYNKSWTNCTQDNDCKVIKGTCGFWDGVVSKKYAPAARRYFICQGKRGGCKKPTAKNNPKPKIGCRAGTCMLTPRQPQIK